MHTIIEPFRIKSVEPIRTTTREEREAWLARSHYNLFQIPADAVLIDLLTDSGTGAMSAEQWAAILRGDESYAGASSFFALRDVVREMFGFDEVLPVHQGRAAERILFGLIGGPGKVVIGNTHFDTTRANIEASGAEGVDLPVARALDTTSEAPFKGDLDVDALEATVRRVGAPSVAAVVMTVTNNARGGQPVSLGNLRAVRAACTRHGIPLYLDAARFAENAWLAREQEPSLARMNVAQVARLYFDECDGFLLSGKKDSLCNMGGLLGIRDKGLLAKARTVLVVTEGFPTYGGLSGRDLEAMAQGLRESCDHHYLEYRAAVARYLAAGLRRAGVPHVRPPGLHAIYVDAGAFLPHLSREEYPGQALAIELYREAGIRSCEVGALLRGDRHGGQELLRLALPRRVYTQSHVDYVIEAFELVAERRHAIRGVRLVESDTALRHFTAKLAPADAPQFAKPAR